MERPAPDDRILARLRWPLRNVVFGKDPGGWRSAGAGDGLEISTVREYVPGDDVRRINWTASARTGQLHMVVPVAERALSSRIVLDATSSMSYGSVRSKLSVALESAETLNRVASRHCDRVEILSVSDQLRRGGAHQGRAASINGARLLDSTVAVGSNSIASALLATGADRSGLLIAISDFRDESARQALEVCTHRGSVVVVVVFDPHERELPDVGTLTVRDPESFDLVTVDTSDAQYRESFARAAEESRQQILAAAAGAVAVVEVSTAGAHGGTQVVRGLLAKAVTRR